MDVIEPPSRGRRRRDTGSLVVKRSDRHMGYEVVYGHHAYFRAEKSGAARVLCQERVVDPDEDPLELLAELNALGGRDPLEEAEAIKQAMTRLGVSQRELAAITGYTQPHISKRLALLNLSVRHQRMLLDGQITLDEARDLARRRPSQRTDAGRPRAARRQAPHAL